MMIGNHLLRYVVVGRPRTKSRQVKSYQNLFYKPALVCTINSINNLHLLSQGMVVKHKVYAKIRTY